MQTKARTSCPFRMAKKSCILRLFQCNKLFKNILKWKSVLRHAGFFFSTSSKHEMMECNATVKSHHIPQRNIKVDPTWGLYRNNRSILLHTPTPATPTQPPYFPQFPPDYTRNGAELNMEGEQFTDSGTTGRAQKERVFWVFSFERDSALWEDFGPFCWVEN